MGKIITSGRGIVEKGGPYQRSSDIFKRENEIVKKKKEKDRPLEVLYKSL
jgi:hypothetical protein